MKTFRIEGLTNQEISSILACLIQIQKYHSEPISEELRTAIDGALKKVLNPIVVERPDSLS